MSSSPSLRLLAFMLIRVKSLKNTLAKVYCDKGNQYWQSWSDSCGDDSCASHEN